MLKNSIQAVLIEKGIHLTRAKKNRLLSVKHGMEVENECELTHASELNIKKLS
jgi:hypothetical protein